MSTTLVLKSGTNSRGPKNDWPVRLQARVIELSQKGRSAKAAFAEAVEEYNKTATIAIVLTPSYTNKYAGSVLWGMKARFQERLKKNDKETIIAAQEHDLLAATADVTA